MTAYAWQKSSYCAQGESCVHVAATAQKSSYCAQGEACVHISTTHKTIHLTESADPTRAVLSATPDAFDALVRALKQSHSRATAEPLSAPSLARAGLGVGHAGLFSD